MTLRRTVTILRQSLRHSWTKSNSSNRTWSNWKRNVRTTTCGSYREARTTRTYWVHSKRLRSTWMKHKCLRHLRLATLTIIRRQLTRPPGIRPLVRAWQPNKSSKAAQTGRFLFVAAQGPNMCLVWSVMTKSSTVSSMWTNTIVTVFSNQQQPRMLIKQAESSHHWRTLFLIIGTIRLKTTIQQWTRVFCILHLPTTDHTDRHGLWLRPDKLFTLQFSKIWQSFFHSHKLNQVACYSVFLKDYQQFDSIILFK